MCAQLDSAVPHESMLKEISSVKCSEGSNSCCGLGVFSMVVLLQEDLVRAQDVQWKGLRFEQCLQSSLPNCGHREECYLATKHMLCSKEHQQSGTQF
eukprot:2392115-Amphidinium_carterae.1